MVFIGRYGWINLLIKQQGRHKGASPLPDDVIKNRFICILKTERQSEDYLGLLHSFDDN